MTSKIAKARKQGAECAKAYGLYHDNPYSPVTQAAEAAAWEAGYHTTLHGLA